MNLSFVDFIEKYLTNPIKLYDYQKEILKNISSNKEPFNFNKIMLKQRQISRRFEHMLRLYYELLSNNDVLDLFLGLHFQFEVNDDDELELVIDEYSQIPSAVYYAGSVGMTGSNICKYGMYREYKDNKKKNIKYRERLFKALKAIDEVT